MSCKRKLIDTDDSLENQQGTPKRRELPSGLPQQSYTYETTAYPLPSVSIEDDLCVRKVIDEFIFLYEMLDNTDDKETKPNYSYTELVFLAIMRSPNFCLPIHEIYRYVESRYSYFTSPRREHWKNAVRHSLSKTRCFTKIGVDSVPKKSGILNRSCYLWSIAPRSIIKFARGEYRPSGDGNGMNTLRWTFQRVDTQHFWEFVSMGVCRRIETLRHTLNSSPNPSHVFGTQTCQVPLRPQQEPTCVSAGQTTETGDWWDTSVSFSHSAPLQGSVSREFASTPQSRHIYGPSYPGLAAESHIQPIDRRDVSRYSYSGTPSSISNYRNASCSYVDSGINSSINDSCAECQNKSTPSPTHEMVKIKQELSPSVSIEAPRIFANLDLFPSCPDFPALSPISASSNYLSDSVSAIYSHDMYAPLSLPHGAYVCSSPIVTDNIEYLPCMYQREMPKPFTTPIQSYRPYFDYSDYCSPYQESVSENIVPLLITHDGLHKQ